MSHYTKFNLILGFAFRSRDIYVANIKGEIIREKIFKLITKHSRCYAARKNKLEKEGKTESSIPHTANFFKVVNKEKKMFVLIYCGHV